MLIQSSDISMSSYRKYEQKTSFSSSVTTWGTGETQNQNFDFSNYSYEEDSNETDGSNAVEHYNRSKHIGSLSVSTTKTVHKMIFDMTFNYLLNLIFGNETFDRDSFLANLFSYKPERQQKGGNYTTEYYHSENEQTSFDTTGKVVTSDGREFNFNVSVNMSREFEKYYGTSIDWGAAKASSMCDPLVINLDTPSANVTDYEFYFDIDSDGIKDKISHLGPGSGFLALDKNGDGIINDGSELFGASSGDGFYDLAAYDTDGNGWIDEADAIFGALKIWIRKPDGSDMLIPISAAGIGAIYLGSADTRFSLNNAGDNTTNALVRKTGIFLYENGMAGTIQHVDMAMH